MVNCRDFQMYRVKVHYKNISYNKNKDFVQFSTSFSLIQHIQQLSFQLGGLGHILLFPREKPRSGSLLICFLAPEEGNFFPLL